MPYSYYDIDTILAEEELVPCTTLLTFRHLAFLDPDYLHTSVPLDEPSEDYSADAQQAKRRRGGGAGGSGGGGKKRGRGPPRHLPEKSLIKMPLWAVDKWANLGFCRVGIPRHFGRSARERLEADPSVADIRYVRFVVLLCVCNYSCAFEFPYCVEFIILSCIHCWQAYPVLVSWVGAGTATLPSTVVLFQLHNISCCFTIIVSPHN